MKLITKLSERAYLGAILLLAAGLQLCKITRSSIWYDEGFTAMLISRDWGDMFRIAAGDVHPPLYYMILKPWSFFMGNSELALRGLSVIFALAAIAVSYFFVKRVFDERTARVAVFFLAIGPFFIRYAQEARMYTMAAFLLVSATYFLYRLVTEKQADQRLWYVYGLLISAALYTHYYSLFIIAMHWAFYLEYLYIKKKDKQAWLEWLTAHFKRIDVGWWKANSLAAILFIPWAPIAYAQFTAVQQGFWIPPVSDDSIFEIFSQFFVFSEQWQLSPWGSTLVMGLMILFFTMLFSVYQNTRKAEKQKHRLMILYFAFSPLVIYFLSLPPLQPVFHVRYFSLAVLAFYLYLGVMLVSKPYDDRPRLQWVLGAILALSMLYGVSNVYDWGQNSMRDLMAHVESERVAGEEIISIEHFTYYDVAYYADDFDVVRIFEGPDFGSPVTHFLEGDEARIVSDLEYYNPRSGNSVWLVAQKDQVLLKDVPSDWRLLSLYETGSVAAYHYYID